jgi:hypothetical protein
MSFHEEILTAGQRKALRLLGPSSTAEGFYLAGGTAIALHLGHRRSVDFDWFLGVRMADPLRLAGEIRAQAKDVVEIGLEGHQEDDPELGTGAVNVACSAGARSVRRSVRERPGSRELQFPTSWRSNDRKQRQLAAKSKTLLTLFTSRGRRRGSPEDGMRVQTVAVAKLARIFRYLPAKTAGIPAQ